MGPRSLGIHPGTAAFSLAELINMQKRAERETQSPDTLKLGNRGQHSQGSGSAILVHRRHLSDYEKSLASLSTRAAFRRFVRRSEEVLMLEHTYLAFCIVRVCRNAS
jgi:hypothetical protein